MSELHSEMGVGNALTFRSATGMYQTSQAVGLVSPLRWLSEMGSCSALSGLRLYIRRSWLVHASELQSEMGVGNAFG